MLSHADDIVKVESNPLRSSSGGTSGGTLVVQDPGCRSSDGRNYNRGDTYVQGNFKFECLQWGGNNIIACLTLSGEEVPVGQRITTADRMEHRCYRTSDSSVRYESRRQPGRRHRRGIGVCHMDGDDHNTGEEWTIDGVTYRCRYDGSKEITGCTSREGLKIPVEGTLVMHNYAHKCIKLDDGSVAYSKQDASAVCL